MLGVILVAAAGGLYRVVSSGLLADTRVLLGGDLELPGGAQQRLLGASDDRHVGAPGQLEPGAQAVFGVVLGVPAVHQRAHGPVGVVEARLDQLRGLAMVVGLEVQLDLRFELREQLTREEWAALYSEE